jgi:hypothetical protein
LDLSSPSFTICAQTQPYEDDFVYDNHQETLGYKFPANETNGNEWTYFLNTDKILANVCGNINLNQ